MCYDTNDDVYKLRLRVKRPAVFPGQPFAKLYVSAAGLLLRLPFRLSFTQRHLPGEPAAAAATRKRTPK